MILFLSAIRSVCRLQLQDADKAYSTIFSAEKYTKFQNFSETLNCEQTVAIIILKIAFVAKNIKEDILCSKKH